MPEKRNLKRRSFSYYMPVIDNNSQEMIGYLADISSRGFRLDCKQPLPTGQDYQLRLDLTGDVSSKSFIIVVGRSKWVKPDDLDPFVTNVGFEIVSMAPDDAKVFQLLVEKYGTGQ